MLRAARTLLLLAGLASLAPSSPALAPSAAAGSTALFERVAVTGASMTDGFLLPLEADAMVTLADTVRATGASNGALPHRRSSAMVFLDPDGWCSAFAADVAARDPTLVYALDFLFWFAYAGTLDEGVRLQRLERGLALLDELECTLLVGDFPDMRPALKGVGIHGAPMIRPWNVPAPATLAKLNERLRAWAATRDHVLLVPLHELVEKLHRGQDIEVRGNRWTRADRVRLLDPDLLHPRLEGAVAVTLLANDVLAREFPELAERLEWDAQGIMHRILEERRAERDQRRRAKEARLARWAAVEGK